MSLKWKFILIAVVLVVAALPWANPWIAERSPWYAETFGVSKDDEVINLGLDLKGGVHVLLEVDIDSALEKHRQLTQDRVGQELAREGVSYDAVAKRDLVTFELSGVPEEQREKADEVLGSLTQNWRVDTAAGGGWIATMPPVYQGAVKESAVESTLNTIRRRIDIYGVREPLVQKQGIDGDRILVQLPGVEDITQVTEILKTAAELQWKEMSYPPGRGAEWNPEGKNRAQLRREFGGQLPADTEFVEEKVLAADGREVGSNWFPLKTVSVVRGEDLRRAEASLGQFGSNVVEFMLTQEAARRFERATTANVNKRMAIVLDGNVMSAPRIDEPISDSGIIRGQFTQQEAIQLALQLRSGSFATELTIIEERTVGPSLGRDSIRAGLTAVLIGFAAVLLFMVVYYRTSGINAVVALAMNVVLVLGAMAYFGATLTLPGIAGLVLVVGMAVDSNVLIFERVREELRIGKTVRSAVDQGFAQAFQTILDCNITTLVAAVFLFLYGTGPVRGFAVTLMIGLVASMFTAVFVSRQLFEVVLRRRARGDSLSI